MIASTHKFQSYGGIESNRGFEVGGLKMNREEQVKKILLMPIISSKDIKGITLATRNDTKESFILSSHSYGNNSDEDMSNIAIRFYKVIYDIDIIKGEKLRDVQFAGDVMNSYNQIARRITCSLDKKEEWKKRYHCLANFWILPMEVGRKGIKGFSKSQVSKDYMDGFLQVLKNRYEEYRTRYSKYFEKLSEFDKFCKYHHIQNVYFENSKCVKITGLEPANRVIDVMESMCIKRADELCKEKGKVLYELFKEMNLIQE